MTCANMNTFAKHEDSMMSSQFDAERSLCYTRPKLAYSSAENKPVCLSIIWVHLQAAVQLNQIKMNLQRHNCIVGRNPHSTTSLTCHYCQTSYGDYSQYLDHLHSTECGHRQRVNNKPQNAPAVPSPLNLPHKDIEIITRTSGNDFKVGASLITRRSEEKSLLKKLISKEPRHIRKMGQGRWLHHTYEKHLLHSGFTRPYLQHHVHTQQAFHPYSYPPPQTLWHQARYGNLWNRPVLKFQSDSNRYYRPAFQIKPLPYMQYLPLPVAPQTQWTRYYCQQQQQILQDLPKKYFKNPDPFWNQAFNASYDQPQGSKALVPNQAMCSEPFPQAGCTESQVAKEREVPRRPCPGEDIISTDVEFTARTKEVESVGLEVHDCYDNMDETQSEALQITIQQELSSEADLANLNSLVTYVNDDNTPEGDIESQMAMDNAQSGQESIYLAAEYLKEGSDDPILTTANAQTFFPVQAASHPEPSRYVQELDASQILELHEEGKNDSIEDYNDLLSNEEISREEFSGSSVETICHHMAVKNFPPMSLIQHSKDLMQLETMLAQIKFLLIGLLGEEKFRFLGYPERTASDILLLILAMTNTEFVEESYDCKLECQIIEPILDEDQLSYRLIQRKLQVLKANVGKLICLCVPVRLKWKEFGWDGKSVEEILLELSKAELSNIQREIETATKE